jgi:4-hydroxy-3-methylbut-2-enyl diphosphate reductase
MLLQRAADIDWAWLGGVRTLGVSAGASAPEVLVTELLDALRGRYAVTVEDDPSARESVVFNLPAPLRAP